MLESGYLHYYAHDHLYSPAALIDSAGNITERYEYDAYGHFYVLEPNLAPDPDGKSDYENPYYFHGKTLDLLDANGLELMSWPYRNYSTYLGRWLQAEKLGMIPNDIVRVNVFRIQRQYENSANLYDAFASNPIIHYDIYGLQPWVLPPLPDPVPPVPDPGEFPVPPKMAGTSCGYSVWCTAIDVDTVGEALAAFLGWLHCVVSPDEPEGTKKATWTIHLMTIEESCERELRSGSGKGRPCKCATCEEIDSCVEAVKERVVWGGAYPNCHTQTISVIKDCCFISNYVPPIGVGPAR